MADESQSAPEPEAALAAPPRPLFERQKNIRYWLRCLRTLLPTEYTSNDLNRTSLAFFCVNGLHLLGELGPLTKETERESWIEWLYSLQHPNGGFRGAPATNFGDRGTPENAEWDPAVLPGTFFSLVTLLALGDDLSRVNRVETLEWIASLQRPDGSFGEMLRPGEKDDLAVKDMRMMHLACGIRWILRGEEGSLEKEVRDVNVDQAVKYIQSCESFDYGFAGRPGLESHAGHTFCAIAALKLLDRIQPSKTTPFSGLPHPEGTLHWLVSRQYALTPNTEDPNFNPYSHVSPSAPTFPPPTECNGFNGRPSKRTDTCYCFWVCGALDILKKTHLVDAESNRNFLLTVTAHGIGGFGKWPKAPPDVLHSYLGAVSLAIFREEGMNRVDSPLCVALQTTERLEALEWRKRRA